MRNFNINYYIVISHTYYKHNISKHMCFEIDAKFKDFIEFWSKQTPHSKIFNNKYQFLMCGEKIKLID